MRANLKKLSLYSLFLILALPALADTEEIVFPPTKIEAVAYVVYDIKSNKMILEHNAEAQLPLASITKLMTIYEAYSESLGDDRTACYTLVSSSNEEADRISRSTHGGIAGMNLIAKDLGLRQTFYLNASGLDITDTISGAYGSALDQAILMTKIYNEYPSVMHCTTEKLATLGSITKTNTNTSIDRIIGIAGSKTGFTDLAGGNLAIIFDAGIEEPVVIIVLGSSQEGRFLDAERLSLFAINYLSSQ
ncbi:MAG TPA: hypothetical protein VJJ22_05000 [Candidatus Paceibacterota bacterium]